MGNIAKGLVILGSTGSIGVQTLDVVRSFPNDFNVIGLAAGHNIELLLKQVREFNPKLVFSLVNQSKLSSILPENCTICDMTDMLQHPSADLVMIATVGEAGLKPTIAALENDKQVALANKEVLVMAGKLITTIAKKKGWELRPVDSEPSAIWQCLIGENKSLSRIIITASGGALRDKSLDELSKVKPAEALQHPTWTMGQKITIDSATLVNKAFEVVEAHWLFDTPCDKIEVVKHPQSIIHSMVEFEDGSIKAQLGSPNMRLPIQYSLFYPKRMANPKIPKLNPIEIGTLNFQPLDHRLFPCFNLALETCIKGGTWPAVLSVANELAVKLFLESKISFLEIESVIKELIQKHKVITNPSLTEIIEASKWVKTYANKLMEL